MNLRKILMGGIFILVVVSLIPFVKCDTDEFGINSLEVHLLLEDDGDVFITEISDIELESPKSLIQYDLSTQTPFHIENVIFNGEYQEFKAIRDFPWGKTSLLIQIDSDSREGKLEVFYTTRIWYSYQQNEAEIFISRFYLRNFEKLHRSLTEIPITIEIPKSFDMKFNKRMIANLRYSPPDSPSDSKVYFHALDVYEQHVSGSKRYITTLLTEDAYKYEDTTSLLLDIEFILIIAKDFPYKEYIDYYRIDFDASDPENIVAIIEIHEVKLEEAVTEISFFPSENISVDATYYFGIEVEKDKETESVVRIYYRKKEDIFGRVWQFTSEYNIKYDKFVRYQTYLYDIFSWEESFSSNPRIFRFTLNIPSDAILLKASPTGAVTQNSISWSENSLPSDPYESQTYFVKFIPVKKHQEMLWILILITIASALFYIAGTRYFLFNRDFTGFLMGWISYVLICWFFIQIDSFFYDLLVFSQIPILLFFAYLFGDYPRFYRLLFASLVISLWFYQDFLILSETIAKIIGIFLDFQDVGSKIFAAVIIYLAGKYGKSFVRKCVLFVRKNAKNMAWIALFALIAFIALSFARISNEYYFKTKISFTCLFGLCMLFLMMPSRDFTYHMKCKVRDAIIKRGDVCFFECWPIEIYPKTPFSRKLEARKSLWVRLSNENGYSVRGLSVGEIKIGQELEIYGDWIMEKEISREDAALIRGIRGMIKVMKAHIERKSLKRDLRYLKNRVFNWKLKILSIDFFIDDEGSTTFKIVHGERNEPYASEVAKSIEGKLAEEVDETEFTCISEELSQDDPKNFNLILIGTEKNNSLIRQLVENGVRPDDKSPSDWMTYSERMYKFYTDPYKSGTDVVVISGLDDKEVMRGVQKFIDIGLLKVR